MLRGGEGCEALAHTVELVSLMNEASAVLRPLLLSAEAKPLVAELDAAHDLDRPRPAQVQPGRKHLAKLAELLHHEHILLRARHDAAVEHAARHHSEHVTGTSLTILPRSPDLPFSRLT